MPFQAFQAADESLIIAVGNDAQFVKFCDAIRRSELATDPRFVTNALRVQNRETLVPILVAEIARHPAAEWLTILEQSGIPCGPVNSIDRVFHDPRTVAREMLIEVPHPTIGLLKMAWRWQSKRGPADGGLLAAFNLLQEVADANTTATEFLEKLCPVRPTDCVYVSVRFFGTRILFAGELP